MLFSSYVFLLLFLPLSLLGFRLSGRLLGSGWQLVWLLLCSLFFYGFWNPLYLWLLLASIACNFVLGKALLGGRVGQPGRKGLLLLGLLFNLGLLAYFKYAAFIVQTVLPGTQQGMHIVLPLAISFFTFQQIAFLVDCYRGLVARIDPLRYALFVSFFPQLIAGPIVHHTEIFPQLSRDRALSPSALAFAQGLTRFVLGLAKKLLLADPLGQLVGPVFATPPPGLTGLDYSVALLAFSLQIYLDFSAYSDMAIGLGQLFGVKLPENFNSPYKAISIADFWRRWHMTLSRFLRDYLYIPLGGNRRGQGRRWLNLMVTMLLGGLWHGAAWQFVVWGGIHGMLLVAHQLWRRLSPWSLPRLPAMVLTFFCVSIAWLFFVAPDLSEALRVCRLILSPQAGNWQFSEGFLFVAQLPWFAGLGGMAIGTSLLLSMGLMLVAVWVLPNGSEILTAHSGTVRWQPNPAWALMLAPLVLASVSLLQGANVFVYFQF